MTSPQKRCRCIGILDIHTYEQRMRARRSYIASVSSGAYILHGTPTVEYGGANYKVGDYLYMEDGVPTMQPALFRVKSIHGNGHILDIDVINAGSYMEPPSAYIVASTTKSGSGYGATFDAVFIAKPKVCSMCGLDNIP